MACGGVCTFLCDRVIVAGGGVGGELCDGCVLKHIMFGELIMEFRIPC